VFWIVHLNKGLRLFPATIIVPTMQIAWTLFSVIGGGIFFQVHGRTRFALCLACLIGFAPSNRNEGVRVYVNM
jgi:hypothetical protein